MWCFDVYLLRHNDVNTRHSTTHAKSKNYNFDFMQLCPFSFLCGGKFEFFLISCNFTPFLPIEMEFLPEIIEFYTDNQYSIFPIIFLNFNSDAKFGHHLRRHNSSQI